MIGIGWTEDLNPLNVVRWEGDIDFMGGREIPKIEGLENIFFYVLLIDSTKIVESFDILHLFTDIGFEVRGDADNG